MQLVNTTIKAGKICSTAFLHTLGPIWESHSPLVSLSLELLGKNFTITLFMLFLFDLIQSLIHLYRGIFITGSSLLGSSIKMPRIKSKNLIRYVSYFKDLNLTNILSHWCHYKKANELILIPL